MSHALQSHKDRTAWAVCLVGAGLGGLLFGLLLGSRNGGLFGGGQDPMAALALGQLSDLKAAVPLAASEVKTSIAQSENALSNQQNQSLIAILQAVNGVGTKVDAATITNLQTELMEARGFGRARENEVNVSQTVNQAQAQNQMQSQLNGLSGLVGSLITQTQRTAQDVINIGSGVANATQTAVQR